MNNKILVSATVSAPQEKVWDCYTNPEHIVHWNFADPSWHCPQAENDLKLGGIYKARMEARDGSFGFDFEAVYTKIVAGSALTYEFGGREADIKLEKEAENTRISIQFDPEEENPIEMQRAGWQAILNNFKRYVESQ